MTWKSEWIDRADCKGMQDIFLDDMQAERAKSICRKCPVRRKCLDFAIGDPSLVGVWGATDEGERRELRRKARSVA